MKENKKKFSIFNLVMVVTLVAIFSYVGFEVYKMFFKPFVDRYEGEKVNLKLEEIEPGTIHVYTEEEKEQFRQAALPDYEAKVKELNLKPGQDYYAMKRYLHFKEKGYLPPEETTIETFHNIGTGFLGNIDASLCKYNADTLTVGNIIDDGLKLKEPQLFAGYVSVGNTEKIINHRFEEGAIGGVDINERFRDFIAGLKIVDNLWKDSTNSKEYIYNWISENKKWAEIAFHPSVIDYANLDVEQANKYFDENLFGGEAYYNKMLIDERITNSTLPLHALLILRAVDRDYFLYDFVSSKNITEWQKYRNIKYDVLDSRFNKFYEISDYRVSYVPSSVTKLNDNKYLIRIEVDQPIDSLASNMIESNIRHIFGINGFGGKFDGDVRDVLVEVRYKDLNYSEIREYNMFSIFNYSYASSGIENGFQSQDDNLDDFYNYEFAPNEKCEPWVKEYFQRLDKAFKENGRFSIFETIKDISKQFNVPYDDVECVIMNIYFTIIKA